MAQTTAYTKLSDLIVRSQSRRANVELLKCGSALGFIAEALRELESMSNDEREETMKQLTAWMITNNFGVHARPAIDGLHKYCTAECLMEDPDWTHFGS
jgi:hypothetical protein